MLKLTRRLFVMLAMVLSFFASAASLQLEFMAPPTQSAVSLGIEQVNIAASDQADTAAPESESQDGYLFLDAGSEACLPNSRRVLSMDEVATKGEKPDYFLVISFQSPDQLAFARLAEFDLHLAPSWELSASDQNLRLGGWKESNLQYRFLQSSLV